MGNQIDQSVTRAIFIGTENPAKLDRFSYICECLAVKVFTPADMRLSLSISENCGTAEANARLKAIAWHRASGLPSLSVDYALHFIGLSAEDQPGVYVRRIDAADRRSSDEEALGHYVALINRLGGQATGEWTTGIAIALASDRVYSTSFTNPSTFVLPSSPISIPGEPLLSLEVNRAGQYLSEMSKSDLRELDLASNRRVLRFLHRHLRP